MVKRIVILLWMMAFTVPNWLYALSYIEHWDLTEYGNCEVGEIHDDENFSSFSLTCKSVPNEKEQQSWVRLTVSKDAITLIFKPTEPISYAEDPTVVPNLGGETIDGKYVIKLPEPPTDSVKVRYRIDEKEFTELTFEPRQHFFYTYVVKTIDRDELSDWITELESAESIEFDIDGEDSPAATITLEKSMEAVKDFRERINLLDQQQDTDQEAEE